VEKLRVTHLLSNEEKETWIKDYVERKATVARKWVEDAKTVIMQEQEDIRTGEKAGLTTRGPENMFQEKMVAIRDSLSDLARSLIEEVGEDMEDKDTELGKLSEDDEPGRVMGTICQTGLQHLERMQQKQMKRDEFEQAGWGDTTDYLRQRDEKYSITEMRVRVVVKPQTDDVAATHAPTIFGEFIEYLDCIPRKLQMPPATSWPGSSRMRPGSGEPLSDKCIVCLPPEEKPNSWHNQTAKPE